MKRIIKDLRINEMNLTLSVSDQCFETKPPKGSAIYSKLTFTQQTVSLLQFLEFIRSGYMFCGVYDDKNFPNKNYKTSQHLVSNNVISIDIDDCDCSMRDFMSSLKYSPSIAYETFSNLEEGKGYRFRFLYVFDDFVDGETYSRLYYAICKANNIECPSNDTSTASPYQKIWGTNGKHRDVIGLGYVYHIDSFKDFMVEGSVQSTILKNTTTGINQVNWTPKTEYKFKDKTFENMWNTAADTEILKQMTHYQTLETTYINFNDGELWRDLTDEEYYCIKRKWQRKTFNGRNVVVITKVKNGEHRRKKIYLSLIRRRLIDPTITLEHLCYAALFELNYFIANTDKDDYITRYQLTQMAQNAMNADLENYKKLKENKKFKVNKMEAKKQGLSVAQAVGKANAARRMEKKEKDYQEMKEKYDKNKSVRQNAEILGVSKGTIQALKKWILEQEKKKAEQLPTQDAKGSQNAKKVAKTEICKPYPTLEEEDMTQLLREDINYNKINNKIDLIIKKLERIENINNINNTEDLTPSQKFKLAFSIK